LAGVDFQCYGGLDGGVCGRVLTFQPPISPRALVLR
jgi:hypothetical protein